MNLSNLRSEQAFHSKHNPLNVHFFIYCHFSKGPIAWLKFLCCHENVAHAQGVFDYILYLFILYIIYLYYIFDYILYIVFDYILYYILYLNLPNSESSGVGRKRRKAESFEGLPNLSIKPTVFRILTETKMNSKSTRAELVQIKYTLNRKITKPSRASIFKRNRPTE